MSESDLHRFRFSDPEFDLPDVESVLDALEAAVITPDTAMFDVARQSWQPVARHPEVRSAWEAACALSPARRRARSPAASTRGRRSHR